MFMCVFWFWWIYIALHRIQEFLHTHRCTNWGSTTTSFPDKSLTQEVLIFDLYTWIKHIIKSTDLIVTKNDQNLWVITKIRSPQVDKSTQLFSQVPSCGVVGLYHGSGHLWAAPHREGNLALLAIVHGPRNRWAGKFGWRDWRNGGVLKKMNWFRKIWWRPTKTDPKR